MIIKYPIRFARKVITKYNRQKFTIYPGYVQYTDQEANDLVRTELLEDKPLMLCKFGTTEFDCIRNYLSMQSPKRVSDIMRYVKREKKFLWWWEHGFEMWKQSGFFPPTDKMLDKFVELVFDDIKEIDILCSYIKEEAELKNELAHAKKINTAGVSRPWRYEHPWTKSLEGKKVLVVHPFEESIQSQYKKRHLLFKNPDILPEFELTTIKAVQTIAHNQSNQFSNWFEALDYMKDKISNTDFDIALIGCGAYGMPLAAHVKRMGKKGLHLASHVQILFGIYGKRWEKSEEYVDLINEHWARPLPTEVPANHKKVEGGAYW